MTDPTIPDVAVEAAALALYRDDLGLDERDWTKEHFSTQDAYRGKARGVLAAAYPHIAAPLIARTERAEYAAGIHDGVRLGTTRRLRRDSADATPATAH